MYHLDKLYGARDDDVTALRKAQIAKGGHAGTRTRTVIGEIETPHGRLHVEVDQSADVIHLHGIAVPLADIKKPLRGATVTTSAAFAAATNAEEQAEQRALIGIVISSVLREHAWLDAKVKRRIDELRYTAV